MRCKLLFFILLLVSATAFGQTATVTGTVRDGNGRPIELATVRLINEAVGTNTDPKGYYKLEVPAGKRITIEYSYVSTDAVRHYLKLNAGETRTVDVTLKVKSIGIKEFEKHGTRTPNEAGSVYILDPTHANEGAFTVDPISGVIKSLAGSHNELTSQYSVRGGNFDENLVYVNDFEIYRPFLVRTGQIGRAHV